MKQQLLSLLTHLRGLYLSNRFFIGMAAVSLLSALGFWHDAVFTLAIVALVALLGALFVDIARLYRAAGRVTVTRRLPKLLSLSDEQTVRITVRSEADIPLFASLTDEQPEQLQVRDQSIPFTLAPGGIQELTYPVRALSRGEYTFGYSNVFLQTRWKLAERRVQGGEEQMVPVYPSVIQMKNFALHGQTTVLSTGRRRLRRLTKSYEFDQIKEYVTGDDYRSINWKATGRRNELMVNQYEEERAQRIYCVIDKGRTMLMPFNGLSLLDYAINATLALSNVILKREDRAGLITFSDKIGNVLPADSKPDQLRRILETLYRQEEREKESNYDLLYYSSRRLMGGRSLILLFSNFESNYALDRVLPGLRRISKAHQLVVVLFENTEVADLLTERVADVEDVYLHNTARRYLQERQLMAARLRQNGVQVVLTRPEALTGAVINKYLELKSRGLV